MLQPIRIFPKKGLWDLWKQGWNEIPEVMSSTGVFIASLISVPFIIKYINDNDISNRRYKVPFIVLRPDDPLVKKIKRGPDSPNPTCYKK